MITEEMKSIAKRISDEIPPYLGLTGDALQSKILKGIEQYACFLELKKSDSIEVTHENNFQTIEIDWKSRPWATEVRVGYCSKDMTPDKIGDRITTIKRPDTLIWDIVDEFLPLQDDSKIITSSSARYKLIQALTAFKKRSSIQ